MSTEVSSKPNTSVVPGYGTISMFDFQTMPLSWSVNDTLLCRQIQAIEVARLQAAMEVAGVYDAGDAARRMANEREGFIGEVDSKIATYGWVSLNAEPLGKTGGAFQPAHSEAYMYDFATLTDYRGQGYYPILLQAILADLAKRKIKRAWIETEPGNDTSARAIFRAGFVKVADIRCVAAALGQPVRFELVPVEGVSSEWFQLAQQAHVACG